MSDQLLFDWNGHTIRFADWAADDYGIFEYATRDGRYFFVFDLQPVGDHVRISIVEQPSYDGRSIDGLSTHRQRLYGKHCIDIPPDRQPTNVPDALAWAVLWAEQTGRYIHTGQQFGLQDLTSMPGTAP